MDITIEVTEIIAESTINETVIYCDVVISDAGGSMVDVPIETASANGVNIPIVNKNIDIIIPTKTSDLTKDDVYTKSETYTQTEINNKLSAVYKYKFSVDYYSELPLVHENGDTYNVRFNDDGTDSGANYAWSDELNDWDSLGGLIGLATLTENGLLSKEDFTLLRNLYTADEIDQLLLSFAKLSGGNIFSGKQDFDGMINHKAGEYFYTAASKTADTVNDTRVINSAGVEIHSICTVLGATKGGGTWVETYRVENNGIVKAKYKFSTTIGGEESVLGLAGSHISPFVIYTSGFIRIGNSLYMSGVTIKTTFGQDVKIFDDAFSFSINGTKNTKIGVYDYTCYSLSSDTINDTRTSNQSGVKIEEICTLGNVTKGGGTWIITKIGRKTKTLTNNTSANLLDINVANQTMQIVRVNYSIVAKDATTVRSHAGTLICNIRNQNGVVSSSITHVITLESDLGNITDTWSLTDASDKAVLSLNANAAGLTTTSMELYMDIDSQGTNNIVLL